MIQANELRIGNWTYYRGYLTGDEMMENLNAKEPPYNLSMTTVLDLAHIEREKDNLYEPIPITEEWLTKFGLVKDGHGWDLSDEFDIILEESGNKGLWTVSNIYYGAHAMEQQPHVNYLCMGDCFKYVHQLQNLYFALCGKELTINQTPIS